MSDDQHATPPDSLPTEEMLSLAITADTASGQATGTAAAAAAVSTAATGSSSPPVATGAKVAAQPNAKIEILLNATSNVPIMKRRKWAVEPEKKIGTIISFIHNYLKLDAEEKIFLYVNQTFAPAPDQTVKNLYDCYESNGRLVLYYCKSQAWG